MKEQHLIFAVHHSSFIIHHFLLLRRSLKKTTANGMHNAANASASAALFNRACPLGTATGGAFEGSVRFSSLDDSGFFDSSFGGALLFSAASIVRGGP